MKNLKPVELPEVPPRQIEIQVQPASRRRALRNALLASAGTAVLILWQVASRWTETSVGKGYALAALALLFAGLIGLIFVAQRRQPSTGVLMLTSEMVHWKLPPNPDIWISYDELWTATLAKEDGVDLLLLKGGGKTIALETAWFPQTDGAASVLEDVLARSRTFPS
ncbi:MAG TPA: hypothetical protein VJ725_23365 [Thermoanaerobaculia bacterium]|nr:hypothetical protein [Thermoanaerobaculia bacterium]